MWNYFIGDNFDENWMKTKNQIILKYLMDKTAAQTCSFRVLRPHYCLIKKPFWNVWYVGLSFALEPLWANIIKISRSWNDNLWELNFQIKICTIHSLMIQERQDSSDNPVRLKSFNLCLSNHVRAMRSRTFLIK